MIRLTERQAQVLAFLQEHQRVHGYSPTLREIGQHMRIRSTNGVNDHLRALERKGAIRRGRNQNGVAFARGGLRVLIQFPAAPSAADRWRSMGEEEVAAVRAFMESARPCPEEYLAVARRALDELRKGTA